MKHTVRHGGKISCDVRGCAAIFVTYSMATLVRRQAIGAGWRQLPFVMYPEAQRKKVDACPTHAVELAEEYEVEVIAKRVCAFEAARAARVVKTCARVEARLEMIAAKHVRFVKRAAKVYRSIMRGVRRTLREASMDLVVSNNDAETIAELIEDRPGATLEMVAMFERATIAEPEACPVTRPKRGRPKKGGASLVVVLEVLREAAAPLSVQEIVELAGSRLPSTSKTPHTVVSRDLAMEIKLKGDGAAVERTAPGRFKLREAVPF